jgi:peroxiredoxin
MSLQDRIDAFKADFQAGKPPYNAPAWIHEPMHRATNALIDSGAASRALKVGDKAPTFTLKDSEGHAMSSADLLAQGPLIVTFYRGVWCPYCNMDLKALQAALPELASLGAHLVAISPQAAPNSRKSVRENNLTFPILSDPRNDVAEGAVTLPCEERERSTPYGSLSRRDGLTPRGHRRGAQQAVCLG